MKIKEKDEICRTRKNAKLGCAGCQYTDSCSEYKEAQGLKPEEPKAEEPKEEGIPADIKPNTKQAKIYGMLKEGMKAADIIKTKEFAPESVYIVARKHFPEALSKPQKKEDSQMQKALQIVKEYMNVKPEAKTEEKPLPKAEVNPKIAFFEKIIKEGMNWKTAKLKTMKYLETVKTKLEQGELIEAFTMLQDIIEAYRKEVEKEAEDDYKNI